MAASRIIGWFAAALFMALLSHAPAVAQQAMPNNVPPRTGAANLDQLEARRRAVFRQVLADPSDLDASFEYAALSSQVGDLEAAIATLERMLIFAPGLPRLQLELGVLYFRLGALESARNYFRAVAAQDGVPDDVQARIAAYLSEIDTKSSGHKLSGVLTLGGRYQTNANAATSSRTVNLNGLEFILSDAAMASPDFNLSAGLGLNYTQNLSAQGDRFDAVLNAYGALYRDRTALNVGVVELAAGPSFDLGRFGADGASLGVYGLAGGALLHGSPYLATAGAGVVVLGTLAPDTRVSLRGEYRHETYANSPERPTASNNNGDRVRITAGIEHRIDENVLLFGATSLERRAAQVNFASLWEASVQAGITVQYASPIEALTLPWSVTFAAGMSTRLADGPDLLISTAPETGQDYNFSLTNTMPLAPDLALQAQLGYRFVTSNYDTRRFNNLSASLNLQKKF